MIQNHLKTFGLLGALTGILIWIGSFWGANGMIIGLIFALIMNIGSYWFSDKMVLKLYKAQEANFNTEKRLCNIVKGIAEKAGIPMPKVYIIPSEASNAFATGRDPNHSAVACTKGLLELLTDSELKGVVAHEISHIKNRDILVGTIAATIAGVISYVAMMARWGAMFGGTGRDRDGGNILELLALAIITPLVAMIIQMAISRSREYLADDGAARILNDSQGLITALKKIHQNTTIKPLRFGNKTTASLFIANPFKISNLLSTHPPMEKRIEKLKSFNNH